MSPERVKLHGPPRAATLSAATCLQEILDARVASIAAAAREAGRAEAVQDRSARAADALDRACVQLGESRDAAGDEVTRLAVRLGIEIARRILRHALPQRCYDIEAIVRETLSGTQTGRAACVVHLHPEDAAALADRQFRSNTVLAADPELALGDVHVETPQGTLVRDIEELLETIEESLMEGLSE